MIFFKSSEMLSFVHKNIVLKRLSCTKTPTGRKRILFDGRPPLPWSLKFAVELEIYWNRIRFSDGSLEAP